MNDEDLDLLMRRHAPGLQWNPDDEALEQLRRSVNSEMDGETIASLLSGWLAPAAAVLVLVATLSGVTVSLMTDPVSPWDGGSTAIVEEDYYRVAQ